MASQTDVGTYSSDAATRASEQAYVAGLGQLAPFGGETCNPADETDAQPRTACADILAEGKRYGLSYLNDGYYRDLFHAKWIANGCMAGVKRSMGYRIELVSASLPQSLARGDRLDLTLTVHNSGWARIFNPRAVEILLRDSSGTVRRLAASGADPRSWLPGQDNQVRLSAKLPAGLPAGRHALLLAQPDPAGKLACNARYAIHPANADDAARSQT